MNLVPFLFNMAFLTGTVTPASQFMSDVTTALGNVVEWFGVILDALIGTEGALNGLFPFVGIAFAMGLIYGGIRLVRTFVPGF